MRIDQLDQQTLNYDSASSFTKLEGFRSSFEESLGEIGDYFGGLDPEAIQSVYEHIDKSSAITDFLKNTMKVAKGKDSPLKKMSKIK